MHARIVICLGGKKGGKSCRHGPAQSHQMTEVCNEGIFYVQGGQTHYREPPAAQIANIDARGS